MLKTIKRLILNMVFEIKWRYSEIFELTNLYEERHPGSYDYIRYMSPLPVRIKTIILRALLISSGLPFEDADSELQEHRTRKESWRALFLSEHGYTENRTSNLTVHQ